MLLCQSWGSRSLSLWRRWWQPFTEAFLSCQAFFPHSLPRFCLPVCLSVSHWLPLPLPENVHILYLRWTNFSLMAVLQYTERKQGYAHALSWDPPSGIRISFLVSEDFFRGIRQRDVSLSHPVQICWGSVVYFKISCYSVIHGPSFILEMTFISIGREYLSQDYYYSRPKFSLWKSAKYFPRLKEKVALGHISTDSLQSIYHTPTHKYTITHTRKESKETCQQMIYYIWPFGKGYTHTHLEMKGNVPTNYVYQNCSLRWNFRIVICSLERKRRRGEGRGRSKRSLETLNTLFVQG